MAGSYVDSLLGDREQILLTARQHWFTLFSAIVLEIIFIIILVVGTALAIAYLSYDYVFLIIGILLLLIPIVTMVTRAMALEWGHYLGLPAAICKLLVGRWILAPWRWSLWPTLALVRRYYNDRSLRMGGRIPSTVRVEPLASRFDRQTMNDRRVPRSIPPAAGTQRS